MYKTHNPSWMWWCTLEIQALLLGWEEGRTRELRVWGQPGLHNETRFRKPFYSSNHLTELGPLTWGTHGHYTSLQPYNLPAQAQCAQETYSQFSHPTPNSSFDTKARARISLPRTSVSSLGSLTHWTRSPHNIWCPVLRDPSSSNSPRPGIKTFSGVSFIFSRFLPSDF